jgi:hypothetical protein
LVEQRQIIAIMTAAIRDMRVDYPAIEPGVARESIPFVKAVLNALDKAGLEIVQKEEGCSEAEKTSGIQLTSPVSFALSVNVNADMCRRRRSHKLCIHDSKA